MIAFHRQMMKPEQLHETQQEQQQPQQQPHSLSDWIPTAAAVSVGPICNIYRVTFIYACQELGACSNFNLDSEQPKICDYHPGKKIARHSHACRTRKKQAILKKLYRFYKLGKIC